MIGGGAATEFGTSMPDTDAGVTFLTRVWADTHRPEVVGQSIYVYASIGRRAMSGFGIVRSVSGWRLVGSVEFGNPRAGRAVLVMCAPQRSLRSR